METRILVPLDGSRLSEQSLPYAMMLGQRLPAELVLLSAVSIPSDVREALEKAGLEPEPLFEELEIEAGEYLEALAHLLSKAELSVVHAFDPVPSYLGDPWRDQVTARHVSAGQEVADNAAQSLQEGGIDVIVEVLEGPPADAILKVADVRACDLIVMSSRGHGTFASLLLGSVSHRVLSHARIPVMIVRA
jgi:nucleotide-binding universal stress UspA family protein